MDQINWNDLRVFLAIADEGGLKKAARRLDLHHSSCARRITVLEASLSTTLFERRSSGYWLTEAGRALYLSAARIRDEFISIEREVLGKDKRIEGKLCLTLPNGLACHLLMPDLRSFMDTHNRIDLKINMSYEYRDLSSREADIAIRHITDPPDSFIGKRVARLYNCAYASTEYLQVHNVETDPEACFWLGWGDKSKHLQWPCKNFYPDIPVRADMYSDVLQLEAIKSHAGIASLPCYMADGIEGIERLPNVEPVAGDWIWVLAHKDMANNEKVRRMIDFLAQSFRRYELKIKGSS
ncbi:LysR family transcriptional regulator [Agaribacterium sp. ZY112]|uniref:LysR family transcriptional regulator n=1 Tax=Agaribacterium sp. ZY112 TaxID=3233574 RepID=UPI003525AB3E